MPCSECMAAPCSAVGQQGMRFAAAAHACNGMQVLQVSVRATCIERRRRCSAAPRHCRFLDYAEKVPALKQMGECLIPMHNNNVIHGDIKPENFLMRKRPMDGTLKMDIKVRAWAAADLHHSADPLHGPGATAAP